MPSKAGLSRSPGCSCQYGPIVLRPGDVALARGTEHYVFADGPSTPPQVIIHPGQRCTTLSGEDLRFEMAMGVRTWGNSPSGVHRAVICAYEGRSEVGVRLLGALLAIDRRHGPTFWWLRSVNTMYAQ